VGLLKIFFSLFIISFPIAEVGRIQFPNGVSFSVNDILLFLSIASWLVYIIRKKSKEKNSFLKKPILLFSLVALVSLLLNFQNLGFDKFLVSSLYLLRWFSYALVYFIVKEFDKKFKVKLTYLLLFSGFAVVLLGYIQYFFYPSLKNLFYLGWDEHLYRMFSSFLDPNFAGAFFVLFFLYLIGFLRKFIKEKALIKLIVVSILSVLTGTAIYLTYSRSALVMLIISIVVFLILLSKKRLIAAAIGIIILFVFLAPKSFKTEGTNIFRITSSYERIASVQVALNIFEKSPVIGIGFNAYRYALNKYEGMNNIYWQTTHSGGGTDNSFLFVLATTGIIGLTSYFFLLYKIFKLGKDKFKKNIYSTILVSSIVGLIVNSLFVNSLFFIFIMEWIWILAGLTESS
jgi:O-antigen ligase